MNKTIKLLKMDTLSINSKYGVQKLENTTERIYLDMKNNLVNHFQLLHDEKWKRKEYSFKDWDAM